MKSKTQFNYWDFLIGFLKRNYIAISICLFFLAAYLTLSLVKHFSFLSGYDLSVIDQAIWKYSRFKVPITTTHVYYDTPVYYDHLELIFLLIAPFYWIFDSVVTLIVLQVLAVISSGVAIFLLAKKYKLKTFVTHAILISYLSFFGIQFAIWSDVHSLVFGVAFLSWFLFFQDKKQTKLTLLFLLLALFSKEDIGLLALLISSVYYIFHREKLPVLTCLVSICYLVFVFYIYFPHFVPGGYRFANPRGLLSDLNPYYFINTIDKQKTILYSLGWFGFLPLLAPLYIVPFVADLAHYFVLGNAVVTSAQGLFEHYRSSVALLLVWPTIIVISKYKRLNNWRTGLYLLVCVLFFQYYLHLPLSYLAKSWFWRQPPEVKNINSMIAKLPPDASLATQNNIAVHLAHRDQIYTLFPNQKDFFIDSPCVVRTCRWFRVGGNPKYLLIDTGPSWNALHFLGTRQDFESGISNLEKTNTITLLFSNKTARLYKINKHI